MPCLQDTGDSKLLGIYECTVSINKAISINRAISIKEYMCPIACVPYLASDRENRDSENISSITIQLPS